MNEEFDAMLAEHLNSKYKEIEMKGIIIGWNACLAAINEQIKDLHNAKKIKQLIKDKIAESHKRVEDHVTVGEETEN